MAGDTLAPENIFSILLSTDNHLGYGEKKPIIDQDSFRTFEEILEIAVKQEVDMILLGGDLFHDVQPSNHTIYKCTELLKRYCLGDRPVAIEFLSDPSENFQHLKNPIANFEDPNLNVSIPVFSIHGNHDNPSGALQISGLDIIASTGLINYFGRWTNIKEVTIKPILLRKGTTKVALYGLSHIPDQRLARLFQEKKVSMLQPEDDGWFNILVLHQNRANRGTKNFIPTDAIPSFINLVVWGHEHDCDIAETKLDHGPWLTQPGSSVATSLSEGEAQEKHVGVLQIVNQTFKITPVPLVTVRPLMFSEIVLKCPDTDDDYSMEDPKEQARADVRVKVEELIQQAKRKQERAGTQALIPFVRLIVKYYSETQVFNANRMGCEYEDVIANAPNIFKLVSYKLRERGGKLNLLPIDADEFAHMDEWASRVEDVVAKYFDNHDRAAEMSILSVKLLTRAVQKFVDTDDAEAISYAVDLQEKATLDKLIELNPNFEDIDTCLQKIKEQRLQEEDKEITELLTKLNDANRPAIGQNEVVVLDDDDDSDFDAPAASPTKPARGRGSRGGRIAKASTTSTRAGRRGRRAAKN